MLNEAFIRDSVVESDRDEVTRLCRLAGNFSREEIAIAGELVGERLEKGRSSGYYFKFAQGRESVIGFVCYGPVPASETSWDVYWIVVDPEVQMLGLGSLLLNEAETDVAERGGSMIYVETSSSTNYQSARNFYQNQGYRMAAELADFYRKGDNKIIFEKTL